MRSISEIMRDWYGPNYITSAPRNWGKSPRSASKHQASKRGYHHKHNPSKGQRKGWKS